MFPNGDEPRSQDAEKPSAPQESGPGAPGGEAAASKEETPSVKPAPKVRRKRRRLYEMPEDESAMGESADVEAPVVQPSTTAKLDVASPEPAASDAAKAEPQPVEAATEPRDRTASTRKSGTTAASKKSATGRGKTRSTKTAKATAKRAKTKTARAKKSETGAATSPETGSAPREKTADASARAEAPGPAPQASDWQDRERVLRERDLRAEVTIQKHVLASMGISFLPVPLLDLAAVWVIQTRMLKRIAEIYRIDYRNQAALSFIGSLTGTVGGIAVGTAVVSSALKVAPGLGLWAVGVSMPVTSGAATYALGMVFLQHFASGGTFLTFEPQKVRSYYVEQLKQGQKLAKKWSQSKRSGATTNEPTA